MSTQVSDGIVALSVLGGSCWLVRLLRRQIWQVIELFGGVERLIVGLLVTIAVEYSGEVLVAILSVRLIWMGLRDDRPFRQLERGMQIAVLAGLAFLLVTPFDSSLFYYAVPQPESRTGAAVLAVCRHVSVVFLIGSVIGPRIATRIGEP